MKICAPWCWCNFIPFVGLRKLEAFFGLLITIMAISFGYEVTFCLISNHIIVFFFTTVVHGCFTYLIMCCLSVVCACKARPREAAGGDVRTVLCRLWVSAAGAGGWNRRCCHHAPQHLPALSTGQGERGVCCEMQISSIVILNSNTSNVIFLKTSWQTHCLIKRTESGNEVKLIIMHLYLSAFDYVI